MDRAYVEAVDLLGSFNRLDLVRVVKDGRTSDMHITRTVHRSDGTFGSFESSRVTVSFGPGRYSCDITADMLVLGLATIEPRDVKTQENLCFCGEDINYDVPGSEGGEFIATAEFVRKYPQFQVGGAVIGHAQCGLDHKLEPA